MTLRLARVKKPHIQATATPCVHCGADENQLFIHGTAHPDGTPIAPHFNVMCNQCKASGPVAKSAEEAIKAWGKIAPARLDDKTPALLDDIEFDDKEPESDVA
jgi:hypothetical protein